MFDGLQDLVVVRKLRKIMNEEDEIKQISIFEKKTNRFYRRTFMKHFDHILAFFLLFVFFFGVSSSICSPSVVNRPNLIYILADDLGYGDLGFNGIPNVFTPNLDAMASQGMRLNSFYATPTCTPSRVELLTGRYFVRTGLQSYALNCCDNAGLPLSEITMADMLTKSGYYTGMIGKWHLGQQAKYLPTNRGFAEYLGLPFAVNQGAQLSGPDETGGCPYLPLVQDLAIIQQPVDIHNLSTIWRGAAIDFLQRRANQCEPFFLYLAPDHVHWAIPSERQYSGPLFTGSTRGKYGDALQELDWLVGGVWNEVVNLGIQNNTLIVFSSDNGPLTSTLELGGNAGIFSGKWAANNWQNNNIGKFTTWEGGVRVPAFALWPGKIPANTATQSVISIMDVMPTFASIVGAAIPNDRIIDGKDFSNILFNPNAPSAWQSLFLWRTFVVDPSLGMGINAMIYNVNGNVNGNINGSVKAHFVTQSTVGMLVHNPAMLFNLSLDPSEQQPMTAANSQNFASINASLYASYAAYVASIFPLPPVVPSFTNLSTCLCMANSSIGCFYSANPKPTTTSHIFRASEFTDDFEFPDLM
jgi:arylsulfatase A